MAILQMQRVSICALKKDRKAILEKIQSLGVMEMSQVAEDEAGFEKMDTLSARQDFEKKTHLQKLLSMFLTSTLRPRHLCLPVWKERS